MPLQAFDQRIEGDPAARTVAQVLVHGDPGFQRQRELFRKDSYQRVVKQRTGKAPRIAGFPWWLVPLVVPFNTTFRELLEMRYLWREPVQMDNARLTAVLGREPHTPLDEAVEATLVGLGCLGAPGGTEVAPSRSIA